MNKLLLSLVLMASSSAFAGKSSSAYCHYITQSRDYTFVETNLNFVSNTNFFGESSDRDTRINIRFDEESIAAAGTGKDYGSVIGDFMVVDANGWSVYRANALATHPYVLNRKTSAGLIIVSPELAQSKPGVLVFMVLNSENKIEGHPLAEVFFCNGVTR